MMKIGIIGCGTIGSALAEAIEERFSKTAQLAALCDIDQEKARRLAGSLKSNPLIVGLEELIQRSDLAVEAASAAISGEVARKAITAGKDVMVMSVGGLLEERGLFEEARKGGRCIYVPSGALCGLDGVKSASGAKIDKVTLTTKKPPKSLAGAPYLAEKGIDLQDIKQETVLFEGSAREAVKGFPKNVNVAAALSLAGIGPEKTRIRIITSPHYQANVHEVEVEGEFGKLVARTENVPSPQNPKTSFLAVLSAIATLGGILDKVKIGT